MPTLQDSIAKVLAEIQAGSLNEPQPDFRVKAEVPSAQAILEAGAQNDPFRADQLVKFDKPSQPKVDWAALAMVAARNQQLLTPPAAPAPGAPNPLAGIPINHNPLAGIHMPGVQRQGIPMGWRTPQATADRAMAGAREQFDASTPITNTAIRMGVPMVTGAAAGSALGPVGMVAGAAVGAFGASEWAQTRETAQGTRAGVNPLEMAAEGVGAALPMSNVRRGVSLMPQMPRIAGSAVGGGAIGSSALQLAEDGTIDPTRLVEESLLQGAMGTGITGGAHLLGGAASSDAVGKLLAEEVGAVGKRPAVPIAIANAKALYLERGAGQSAARMAQALRDSGYREAATNHGLIAKYISEAEGTPFTPRPEPTRPVRRKPQQPRHNPFHVELESKLYDVDGKWIWGKFDAATGRVVPDAAPAVAPDAPVPSGRAGALARLFSDETGAVGPDIRLSGKARADLEALAAQGDAGAADILATASGPEPATSPALPATEAAEVGRGFTKLPAAARGVLDPLTPVRGSQVSPGQQPEVPDSMGVTGLTPAQRRADQIRIETANRRHNVTPEDEALLHTVFTEGRDKIEQHRRMGLDWAQTDMEASIIVPDVKQTKGTTMNAETLTAMRRMTHGVVTQSVEVSNAVPKILQLEAKAAAGDVAAKAELQQALEGQGVDSVFGLKIKEQEAFLKARVAVTSLLGVKSEVARALNSLKSFQKRRAMGDADFLVKAIEAGGDGQKAMEALRGLRNADGTPNRMAQFKYIRSLSKPNAETYWHWYARTAYLSGVSTQWRNMAGNAVNFGVESLAVRPAAAALDSFNTNRTVTASELRAMGTTSGFLDGLQKASFFFKNGFTADDVDAFENLPPEVFGGALFPNSIGRAMGAVDQFFRTVGFNVELHRMAIAEAHGAGLRGQAMMDKAAALIDDPTITPELVKRAERYAAGLTFQDTNSSPQMARGLGHIQGGVKWVDALKQGAVDDLYERHLSKLGKMGDLTYGLLSFPPSVIIAPFINTPFNILKRAAQYTPFALAAAKEGSRDRMMVAGRGAVGTAMMGAAVGLWSQGRITGKAPAPGTPESEAWYDGRQAYSIRIGDTWVPYGYLGPVGMVLGATANYADAVSKDPKNVLNYFGQLMVQAGRTAVDATFLRGMQSILMAVADDSEDGRIRDKFANRTATGLLPMAGLMRDVRNVVDPTLRKPEGMAEQVMASVPGLSDNVEPRINATGEEVQRTGNILPTTKQEDPVRAELLRLHQGSGEGGYYRDPTEAGSKLLGKINTAIKAHNKNTGRKDALLASVPRPLVTKYAKRYGQESERLLTRLINMPAYQAMNDEDRRWEVNATKRAITDKIDREFAEQFRKAATP